MKQENDIRLKRGWTTGACATAATKAGLYALWSGEKLDVVSITLPKGEQPLFRISFFEQKINSVEVGIIKDAGDDPDVTHGSLIKVKVQVIERFFFISPRPMYLYSFYFFFFS